MARGFRWLDGRAYADERVPTPMLAAWATWPDAGVGVALGSDVGDGTITICVDIDSLDDFVVVTLRASLPGPDGENWPEGFELVFPLGSGS